MQRFYRSKTLRSVSDGALTTTASSPSWDISELSDQVPGEHIGFERLGIYTRITAVSGTTPTMAVALEVSEDNTNWETLTDALTGLNAAGVKTALVTSAYPARYIRLKFTIAGTTPSFTLEARVKLMI